MVPDWSPHGYPKALNSKYYPAAKGRKALVRLSLSLPPNLYTKGVLRDRISRLADVDVTGNEDPDSESLIYSGRSRDYPTGIPQRQAFFRTVLQGENIFLKSDSIRPMILSSILPPHSEAIF